MRKIVIAIIIVASLISSCTTHTFPIGDIIEHCLVLQRKQDIFSVHSMGTMIFNNGDTYTFTGKQVIKNILPYIHTEVMPAGKYTYYIIHNSPNRENLVYSITQLINPSPIQNRVELFVGLKGQSIKKIDDWHTLGQLVDWLDNEWLLFLPDDQPEGYSTLPQEAFRAPGKINLLNPATGEIKEIDPSMPDIYNIAPSPMWYVSPDNPLPVYDPSLSFVFYVRDSHDGLMRYSLWDVVEKQTLWEKTVQGLFARPEWSPDGKQIAYDADTIDPENKWDFELFLVNKKGEEIKITDLSSKYKSVFMDYFAWSPKGDRIAIWIDYSQQGEHKLNTKLSVVDLTKGEIINYCIGSGVGTPMWSPDGKQIIVTIQKDLSSPYNVMLLDIKNNIAVPIDIESIPVAWIKYTPMDYTNTQAQITMSGIA